jgi:hypothetical protein
MVIEGPRLDIGDLRNLIKKGVVLKAFLDIEKETFEVYVGKGNSFYRSVP